MEPQPRTPLSEAGRQSLLDTLKQEWRQLHFLTELSEITPYECDALAAFTQLPLGVVLPENEAQVQMVLKTCMRLGIAVVPRGAGTGMAGSAMPTPDGIVLSTAKLNKIVNVNPQARTATVQPGVRNLAVSDAAAPHGLYYAPDPSSQLACSIGGNVAENAGGMRAAKYGITKDYVMAMRAVLPNGDVIKAGKRTIKDVAGYNLCGILVGSEGTLAVTTEITLRLIAKPKMTKTAMGVFESVESAMEAVYKTFAEGITPVAMEFLDNLTIRAVEEVHKKGLPIDAGAILITDVDGNLEADLDLQLEALERVFKANGCSDFVRAKDAAEASNLWFARRNASQSLKVYGNKKLNEDITVPRAVLPELLAQYKKVSEKYGFNIPCFGHTGDGNVHTNVMTDKNDPHKVEMAEKAIEEMWNNIKTIL